MIFFVFYSIFKFIVDSFQWLQDPNDAYRLKYIYIHTAQMEL